MALVLGCGALIAGCNDKPTTADNTKQNTADASGKTTTPMDQGQGQTDIDITANIRKKLMDDSTLSTDAQNVKVITKDGVVTLRGPVDGQTEKAAVIGAAQGVAGVKNVDSQLEIASK